MCEPLLFVTQEAENSEHEENKYEDLQLKGKFLSVLIYLKDFSHSILKCISSLIT